MSSPPFPEVTVLLGDPSLPDQVKLDGQFNPEDLDTVQRLKAALAELSEYRFRFHDNHADLLSEFQRQPPKFVFNLCDEGYQNDALMELHIPAILDALKIPYSGAGPICLGMCYDKSLIRAVARDLGVPVPAERYIAWEQGLSAEIPAVFPALAKPNLGDGSLGITQEAVVQSADELRTYLAQLRGTLPGRAVLLQEFLSGPEYTVALVGNVDQDFRVLPILEADYTELPPELPRILGYESKWDPTSPYWNQVKFREARIRPEVRGRLAGYSTRLFTRFGCRDYARFDYRTDAQGEIKLLEVNPNPGWCWDGKLNLMAGLAGLGYADLLRLILEAAQKRTAR